MPENAYIAFLRHGAYHQRVDAPSARQPFALTDEGLSQAREGTQTLARMIEDHGLKLTPTIYCSRQLRAWQTASEVLSGLRDKGHRLERVAETSLLGERGLGCAANLSVPEIEAILRDDPRYGPPPEGWKSDSNYRLPLEGAESLVEAGERVAQHIQYTLKPGSLTVHVGHGASFRHACQHFGLLNGGEIAQLSMFHAQPLLFCHDARGNWRHLAGEWKVRSPKEDPID